ncbi:MAG: RNA polymerase sigma factor [Anaerolineae bacterium]|nr:RNA polymerase sigma factor [Anaerolineae bacterium]
MINVEEYDLVARAKEDTEAFGQLYRHYVQRIYNYLYRHTGNVADAEDLTSRTFFQALKHISRYQERPGATFQSWLFRIAHNLVVNWYRDRSRRQHVTLDAVELFGNGTPFLNDALFSTSLTPPDGVMIAEEHAQLRQAIDRLPEERKTLIILKFVEQMSNTEIAAILGKTEGAIKSLYHRTLMSLRKAMTSGGTHET